MREFKDRLHIIQQNQQELLKEYQKLIAEYESSDLIHENVVLREQYEDVQSRTAGLLERVRHMETENVKLRSALSEQILNEKINILRVSRDKLETYFASRSSNGVNRLTALEMGARTRVDQLIEQSSQLLMEEKEAITKRLREFSEEIQQKVMQQRQRLLEEEQKLMHDTVSGLDLLVAEEISEETMQRRMKQNQFEMKLGLNWINKLGVLLIILGVGAAFKYSYSNWFSGYMKGMIFFLLGALMLAGGEWLFRKQKQTFALGLLGGGISVLYGSIFYSYFLLDIIGVYTGILLSILVTLTAVLLSLRYDSRTICSFGLVGGYLPVFSYMGAFGLEGNTVYIAMGYLFLLNVLLLLVSFRKRWIVVHYISFILNTPTMVGLIWLSDSPAVSMLYAVITFLMYLAMTLWIPLKFQSKLSWWDFYLLAMNTLVSCSTLYYLFIDAGLGDFKGLLACVFCLVYLGLGRWIGKFAKQERQTQLLFYATSLTFAILMIPFQFSIRWIAIGWLIEAIVLTIYGSRYRFKPLERVGWGIFMLCLLFFFFIDVPVNLLVNEFRGHLNMDISHFALKYTLITLGMLVVSVLYAMNFQRKDAFKYNQSWEIAMLTGFKYAALLNAWFYLLYEIRYLFSLLPYGIPHPDFYKMLLIGCMTLALAYALTKIKMLYDRVIKWYSLSLYVIGYLICIGVTLGIPTLYEDYGQNSAADYVALFVLIVFNVLVFFSGRDFLNEFMRKQYWSVELYPVIMGVYLIGIISAFLGVQFRLGDAGLLFSLVYLLLAILYIAYGFRKRYVYIRRFGLGLTLLSTGKLLLYDLSLLTIGSKIIAYFTFGIVLLGISYIYQRVSNRLGEPERYAETDINAKG